MEVDTVAAKQDAEAVENGIWIVVCGLIGLSLCELDIQVGC